MGVRVREKPPGSGIWWIFIEHQTKRKSKKIGNNKKLAKEVAKKIEAKLVLGDFGLDNGKSIPLFKEYADSWIEKTVPATCKETTTSDYQAILDNHVLPVFRGYRIDGITEGQVKDFLFNKVTAGFAYSTITHMKNVISGVLTKAVDDKVISENPALNLGKKFMKRIEDAIEARKVTNGEEEGNPDPLSKEELKRLLDKVHKHYTAHYPLFLFLARTGARTGEALGLQWGDIDFNGRFINLKRSLSRRKITTLKGKRIRRVDMSRQLAQVMEAHLVKSKEKGMKLGLGDHPVYVFTNRLGGFVDVNNWRRRVFIKALEKAKLRKIRIHDLRHTYATLRISKGDNIADVSNQLGHFSETFTMKTYFHWIPGKKKSEVDELDDHEYRGQTEDQKKVAL